VNDIEATLRVLINDAVDAELGPRRPVPPFATPAEPHVSHPRPWLRPLLAAASVAAIAFAGFAIISVNSDRKEPATHTTSPVVTTPRTTAAPTPPGAVEVVVNGLATGHLYRVFVWAGDQISSCANHAYGSAVVSYLREHPCRGAWRRLATLELNGREVALSIVTVEEQAPGPKPDTTNLSSVIDRHGGGINDLLREGARIPGAQSRVPVDHAYTHGGEDFYATYLYAWYVDGSTRPQAAELVRLEQDLIKSNVTLPETVAAAQALQISLASRHVGAVALGMTWAQVWAVVPSLTAHSLGSACLQLQQQDSTFSIVINNRRNEVIGITAPRDYITDNGGRVGWTEAQVRASYRQTTLTRQVVNGPAGRVLLVGEDDGSPGQPWLGYAFGKGTTVESISLGTRKYVLGYPTCAAPPN
jgi:hypothetical protein